MNPKKGSQLFNFIAPIYGLFYEQQKQYFKSIIKNTEKDFKLVDFESIIDVGCGTGALSSVMNALGMTVTGIDPAEKMLAVAKSKPENAQIQFMLGNAVEGLPFESKSFDIAITSYVAHGLKPEERAVMYAEMGRLAKHWVIVYDYNENRSITTDFIEWLEGGDYFNFIKTAKKEMMDHFGEVQMIQVDQKAAWYVCKPSQIFTDGDGDSVS